METAIAQARLLLETRRYKDAEGVLRDALAGAPEDDSAHGLLAVALYGQDRDAEALREIKVAIGLAPDHAHHHYVRALILLALKQEVDSMTSILEALRLDNTAPQYHAHLSTLYMQKKAWSKALRAAEEGLRLDPQNTTCANLRGRALVKLGRQKEAGEVVATALARDPENAYTHANQGWTLLESGQSDQAFTHFREALRLDPMSNWARAGIVEAMKAHNPLYRMMLRYFLWMSRLTSDEQWSVVLSLSAGMGMLHTAANAFFPLWLIVLPLDILYRLFGLLTWTARPLFALLVRLDRFGRQALPREEIVASNWVLVCLLTALVSGVAGIVWREVACVLPAVAALMLILQVAGIFGTEGKIRRGILVAYTLVMVLLALGAFLAALTGHPVGIGVAVLLAILFVMMWTTFGLIANLMSFEW